MKALRYLRNPRKLLLALDKRIPLLSDRLFLKLKFKDMMGYKLNLRHPKTFNEKIQWLKLHDRKPEYVQMVDKIEAKKYVAEKIGEEYIIPTISTRDHFDEINLWDLPEQFVIKCSHDSGGLIVCRDKNRLDVAAARKKIDKCLKKNFYYQSREWPYKNVKPKILIEKYMSDKKQKELVDYKFYCFNGSPKYLYVSEGLENHATAKIEFFDMDFRSAPFHRDDYMIFNTKPNKPETFEKMKSIARSLSKGIPFVRVDLYEINGKIYFGELTFTPCGGYMPFNPKEWDEKLGQILELPKR